MRMKLEISQEVPHLEAPKKLEAAELKLAKQLIDQLTVKKFDLGAI